MDFSRRNANYLKGMAISVVVAVHYTQYFATDSYRTVEGLARGYVAIFFVVSGYGIYMSLERRLDGVGLRFKPILIFFWHRAARIFPFYWLALYLTPFFFHEYLELHQMSLSTAAIYLGLPFVSAPGIFWFVTSIIQCYLLSPFFYFLLNWLKPVRYLVTLLCFTSIVTGASILIAQASPRTSTQVDILARVGVFTYRGVILANVALFSLGMAIPQLMKLYHAKLQKRYLIYISAILFAGAVYVSRYTNVLFNDSDLYATYLLVFSCFSLCLFTISFRARLPLGKQFAWIGNLSYPIYLFHMAFFGALTTGYIQFWNNSLFAALLTAALLPSFLVLCEYLDRGHKAVMNRPSFKTNRSS